MSRRLPSTYHQVHEAELVSPSNEEEVFKDYYFPNRQKIKSSNQLIDMWLYSSRIKSDETRRGYRAMVLDLVGWLESEYNMPDLRLCNLAHLQSYITYLRDEKPIRHTDRFGLSKNAIAVYVCAIRSLWKFGCKQSIGYFYLNIASELTVEWCDNTAQRVLSQRRIDKLEVAASEVSQRHWALFNLLFYSGCRIGEVGRTNTNPTGLLWRHFQEDTDEEGDPILILTITGKGNKVRSLHLDAETSEILMDMRGTASDDDPVFPSLSLKSKGKALSDRGIRWMMEQVSDKAGIKFSPHWLRHSHATVARRNGATTLDIREQLGHTTDTMTSRYAKMTDKKGTSQFVRKRK